MPSSMQIESIAIKNFRCFRDVVLNNLSRMTVVVGANGSGKSALFDVFTFLKDALTQNVAAAVALRGGYRELVSRGQEGPIEITVKFRERGGRLATYRLLFDSQDGVNIVIDWEDIRYRLGKYGPPWILMYSTRGSAMAVTNESECREGAGRKWREYKLDDPSILAIKGLGQFRQFQVCVGLPQPD